MKQMLKPLFALMLGAAIFLMGNGLQTTFVPLSAGAHGMSEMLIGVIGSLYFVGFVAGCAMGPTILARAGHVRAYAAMTAIAGAAAALYTLDVNPWAWAGLRMATGFAFAIMYVVIESWLNEVASNQNRGRVFAIYQYLNLTFVTLGQTMIVLAPPTMPTLFVVNGVLITLAAVPILLSLAPQPAPIQARPIRLRRVFRSAPAGVIGAISVGLANGAFWSLAPNFGLAAGLDVTGIAIFMAVGVLAGALAQFPLGRLSDLNDRRAVIAGVAGVAALASLNLGLFATPGWPVIVGIFFFGCTALPIYALSVAHVNDRVETGGFVEAAGAMLLFYGMGAVVGPVLAAQVMVLFGSATLFLFTGTVYAGLAVIVVVRMMVRPPVPEAEQTDFIPVQRPSSSSVFLDPRAEDDAS